MSSCVSHGISAQFWAAHPKRHSETKEGNHQDKEEPENSRQYWARLSWRQWNKFMVTVFRAPHVTLLLRNSKSLPLHQEWDVNSSHIWPRPFLHPPPANFLQIELRAYPAFVPLRKLFFSQPETFFPRSQVAGSSALWSLFKHCPRWGFVWPCPF